MRYGDLGQPRVQAILSDMLARHRVAGSFLFAGPAGVGKEALGIELGRLLNCGREGGCPPRGLYRSPPLAEDGESCSSCRRFRSLQHPDLHLVFPVPSGFWEAQPDPDLELAPDFRLREPRSVAEARLGKARDPYFRPMFERPVGIQADVLREVVLPAVQRKPVEARTKVVILADADQMAFGIGNLLLKTLEEPPAACLLVLTSSVPERLLPTILSRCQRLNFAPLAEEWMIPRLRILHGAEEKDARLAASLSQGSMLLAGRHLDRVLDEVRERAFEILHAAASGDLLQLVELARTTATDYASQRQRLPLLLHLLVLAARDMLLLLEGAVPVEPHGRGRRAGDAQAGGVARAGGAAHMAGAAQADAPRLGATWLVHADRVAELRQLAAAYDSAALRRLIQQAELTERQLAGHAHTELALSALFLGVAREPVRAPAGSSGRS